MLPPVLHQLSTQPDAPTLSAGPLRIAEAESAAVKLKALADPVRLRLLSFVARGHGGEVCVCDLTEPLGVSQPTVSHHMKKLLEAGLIAREQRGRWAFYSLIPEGFDEIRSLLDFG